MPLYPSDSGLWIRAARFVNVLDDGFNALSPVKLNVWGANLATVGAAAATLVAWMGGHASGIADLWAPLGGWLTQAHTVHHFDKRERNKQTERLAAIAAPEATGGK